MSTPLINPIEVRNPHLKTPPATPLQLQVTVHTQRVPWNSTVTLTSSSWSCEAFQATEWIQEVVSLQKCRCVTLFRPVKKASKGLIKNQLSSSIQHVNRVVRQSDKAWYINTCSKHQLLTSGLCADVKITTEKFFKHFPRTGKAGSSLFTLRWSSMFSALKCNTSEFLSYVLQFGQSCPRFPNLYPENFGLVTFGCGNDLFWGSTKFSWL